MLLSPPPAVPSVHTSAFLVLFLFLLSFSGPCTSNPVLTHTGIDFNPAMKPDGNTETEQPAGVHPWTYSSGRKLTMDTKTPSPSEIYPVPPGFADDTHLEEMLRQLRRSKFYWAAAGEQIRVSWEVVVKGLAADGTPCAPPDVGLCDLRDPRTRTSLTCDEEPFDGWQTPTGTTLNLEICSQTRDAQNNPQESQENCRAIEDMCAFDSTHPQHGHFPFCQFSCPLEAFSGTYQVRVQPGDVAKKVMSPTIVRVPYSMDLARPLERLAQDEPSETQSYEFTVSDINGHPIPRTAPTDKPMWQENFSPALRISRIRVFVEDSNAQGGKRYVQPSNLHITHFTDLDPVHCPPDPGLAEFSPRSCVALNEMNPTVQIGRLEDQLVWKVDVPRSQQGQPALTDEDKLFIEFTVASPSFGDQGFFLNACPLRSPQPASCPPEIDLGFISPTRETTFPAQVRIGNRGSHSVQLMAIRIVPRNAQGTTGHFDFELPAHQPLPFILPGGTDIPLTIIARPNGDDDLGASVFFDYREIDPNAPNRITSMQTLVASISAAASDAVLTVTPATLEFTEQRDTRGLIIQNDGRVYARIESADLVGPDVSSFRLIVSPLSYPVALNPSENEFYRLKFVPNYFARSLSPSEVTNSATLVLQTSAGEKRIPLKGTAKVDPTKLIYPRPFTFQPKK